MVSGGHCLSQFGDSRSTLCLCLCRWTYGQKQWTLHYRLLSQLSIKEKFKFCWFLSVPLSLCVPVPMSLWNPFLWCFLEGLWLHTSSCFGVSDAIRSLHVVCIPPQTWGAPRSSSSLRWHGPMVETVIQLSVPCIWRPRLVGCLAQPCILHHSHVPCALWPAWLPTEFLEALWLGQKSSVSWALFSHRELQPGPCACAIH